MQVRYTEKQASINDSEKEKIARRLAKVDKILGPRGGSEAHVVFRRQRHLVDAEISVRAFRNTIVVTASNQDAYKALAAAIDKLHKQISKGKRRRIATHRAERARPSAPASKAASRPAPKKPAPPAPENAGGDDLIHSDEVEPKPMSVAEARLQLEESSKEHLAFHNVETESVSVLIRRGDGRIVLLDLP